MNKPVKPNELPLEPTANQRRSMLIEGVKEFDAKVKPETAEEAVDSALAKGYVMGSGLAFKPPPDDNSFDWTKDADCIILHEQPATAVYHGSGGHIVIRQTNGHEEDVTILIAPENATAFQEGLAAYLRK